MLPLELMTAPQLVGAVAQRARRLRLDRNLTQQELAERAGMSLSSLRRFERTGEIAFLSLVRVAMALDASDGLGALFPEQVRSLDDLLEPPRRQRGRRS
ncbi:MAG: helix-turn-helix transcriptional regulator [Alphaproteobacteria bacterium]|nr:helix-turn-helix transcriptional regulator [Alphaproteobacteria bacterium]MCB9699428.1 helix-turn-helix transcriptional regulator [Alphaproteobacteria bacterium]